jgi:polyhydroxybutyrate depolymerase
MPFGGVMRTYLLWRPAGPVRAVVMLLHGHGGSAALLMGRSPRRGAAPYRRWLDIAQRERLALVVPDGSAGSDGKPGWNDCRTASTNPTGDDSAFLTALAEAVAARSDARPALLVAGTSNGGHMALRLAIERPADVSAVAAVAASLAEDDRCPAPSSPVPLLLINGTADPICPFNGGPVGRPRDGRGAVQGTARTLARWTQVNAVSTHMDREALPDLDPHDGSTVVRETWHGRHPVALLRIQGGGHTEPSRSERHPRWVRAIVGTQNGDIETAEEMWRFFAPIVAARNGETGNAHQPAGSSR